MIAAARIEGSAAAGTHVATRHILRNAELAATNAAKHGRLTPLLLRPDLNWMVRQSLVALLAGVIDAAALHPDRDDVESGSVVSAAGLSIEIDPANFGALQWHRGQNIGAPIARDWPR